jgi:hypothetical protein
MFGGVGRLVLGLTPKTYQSRLNTACVLGRGPLDECAGERCESSNFRIGGDSPETQMGKLATRRLAGSNQSR